MKNRIKRRHFFRLLFSSLLLFGLGCSNKGSNSVGNEPKDKIKSSSISEAISSVPLSQEYFYSYIKKLKQYKNETLALQFFRRTVEDKLRSQVLKVGNDGKIVSYFLKEGENWLDFDVTEDGSIIGLVSVEQKTLDPEFELSLKSLFIQTITPEGVVSRFQFSDSKRESAIKYDKNGLAKKSQHYADNEDLFLTSSPATDFARISYEKQKIYLSVCGTVGFKVFEYSLSGKEIWQREVVPLSDFNTILVDKEAPHIQVFNGIIIVAAEISHAESKIYDLHFGTNLVWPNASEYFVLVQAISEAHVKRQFSKGDGNLFLSDIATNSSSANFKFGLIGTAGGPGLRAAKVEVFDIDLNSVFSNQVVIEKETSGLALAISEQHFFIAGKFGSSQVTTGSVVEFADAFVQKYDFEGGLIKQKVFGSNRDDSVLDISIGKDSSLNIGGMAEGPITHTADGNPNLGYSKSILGKLIW